jgi:phosphopantothenoylcysteine synthetase/decarboxylase
MTIRKTSLVIGGCTQEPVDSVRVISAPSPGHNARRIAEELSSLGPVLLLTSNIDHIAELPSRELGEAPLVAASYATHADLHRLLRHQLSGHHFDAVVMCASVADFRPVSAWTIESWDEFSEGMQTWTVREVREEKIRSDIPRLAVLFEPTEKLIRLVRSEFGFGGFLVSFKLEPDMTDDDLLRAAQTALRENGADAIVANTLSMVHSPRPSRLLVSRGTARRFEVDELPAEIRRLVAGGS